MNNIETIDETEEDVNCLACRGVLSGERLYVEAHDEKGWIDGTKTGYVCKGCAVLLGFHTPEYSLLGILKEGVRK